MRTHVPTWLHHPGSGIGPGPVRRGWRAGPWGGFTRAGTMLIALYTLYAWHHVSWERFVHYRAADPSLADPFTGAAAALGLRIVTVAVEAAYYVVLWRACGRRLRFLPLATAILIASLADLWAIALREHAASYEDGARFVAGLLGGPRVLEPVVPAEVDPGGPFATLGVLTVSRIGLTAWAQAAGLGIGAGRPLLATAGTWLMVRLAITGLAELGGGRAPGGEP